MKHDPAKKGTVTKQRRVRREDGGGGGVGGTPSGGQATGQLGGQTPNNQSASGYEPKPEPSPDGVKNTRATSADDLLADGDTRPVWGPNIKQRQNAIMESACGCVHEVLDMDQEMPEFIIQRPTRFRNSDELIVRKSFAGRVYDFDKYMAELPVVPRPPPGYCFASQLPV